MRTDAIDCILVPGQLGALALHRPDHQLAHREFLALDDDGSDRRHLRRHLHQGDRIGGGGRGGRAPERPGNPEEDGYCNEGNSCHGVILIRMNLERVTGSQLDRCYTVGYTIHMKTAISIPDDLFEAAEKMARKLKISRSEFYQQAVASFLQQHGADVVRESLDRVYAKKSNRSLDPLIRAIGEQIIKEEDW